MNGKFCKESDMNMGKLIITSSRKEIHISDNVIKIINREVIVKSDDFYKND